MNRGEIALQILLKAIDAKAIQFQAIDYSDLGKTSLQNAQNAKMISDFYNVIMNTIDNDSDVSCSK